MASKTVYARGIFPVNTMEDELGTFKGTLVFVPMPRERVAILEILISKT